MHGRLSVRLNKRAVRQTITKEKNKKEEEGNEYDTRMYRCVYPVDRRFMYTIEYLFEIHI